METSPIPQGYQSIIPSLNVTDGNSAIEFYVQAFDAHENFRMSGPDGKVLHSELEIGNCIVFIADEAPEWGALSPGTVGGCPFSLVTYTKDCDAKTHRVVAAGAKLLREPTDYPWGERSALVLDPYGYRWAICTRTEEVAPDELARRMQEWS